MTIKPEELNGMWVVPQRYGMEDVRIGSFTLAGEPGAIRTLRHYPIEGEMTDEHQLGLAEAQLLGYAHRRDGYDLAALVDAMGLTSAEWQELQDKYAMPYLSDDERADITKQLAGDNSRPMREEADALQQFMEERRRIHHSRTIPTEGA